MSRAWRTTAVVSLGVFMASLDLFIVNITFPDIQDEFAGTSLSNLSWVLNGYAIVFAALLVPAGRIADKIGRKRAFIGGAAVFTLASALCAVAPSVELLVGGRMLQAVGGAFLLPTSLALLLPEFPAAKRATAVGIWAAVGGAAAALGPPIGGLLVELSWRWVFLVNLPVGILLVVLGARTLREARDPAAKWPDLVGAALLVGAIGTLTLGIVKGEAWGWDDVRTIGAFVAAVAFTAAFVARSATHEAPVVELPLLRVRSFAVANIGALLFFAAFGAMLLAGVLFLTQVWGSSVLRAGLELAPGPAMVVLTAPLAGRLADRFGQRAVGAPGALVFAAGAAWWAWQVGVTPNYAAELLPGMLLTGIGVGLTMPTLSSAATASLPPERFATGSAVLSTSRQVGTALGVALLIALLGTPAPGEALDAFDRAWIVIAALAVASSIACLALGRVRVADPAAARAASGVDRELADAPAERPATAVEVPA